MVEFVIFIQRKWDAFKRVAAAARTFTHIKAIIKYGGAPETRTT